MLLQLLKNKIITVEDQLEQITSNSVSIRRSIGAIGLWGVIAQDKRRADCAGSWLKSQAD